MIRSGFDWTKINFNGQAGSTDRFSFDGRWTGNPFADFMLGLPSQTSRMPTATKVRYVRTYRISAFVQDDWVISQRLTLNLGLRYEYTDPTVEKHDEFAQFDIEREIYVIANVNGESRALYRPDKNDFGPRIGFAFRPSASSNSVIRGGYGIFYDLAPIGMNLEFTRKAPPFQYTETYDASPTDPNALTMTDPYPEDQLSSAVFSVGSVNPGFRDAYIQQWNLGYQHEFASNMLFEIGYAGSKGTRLYKNIDYNQQYLTVLVHWNH